jgi:Xaa-Pro aminopeptidase
MIPADHHLPWLVPPDEIDRRITRLRQRMETRDVAVAWIDHLADRLYFSGSIQNGVLLVPLESSPVFLVRKSVARARRESPLDVEPHPGRRGLLDALRGLVANGGRVGMTMDVTPAATLLAVIDRCGPEVVNLSTDVRTVRACKSAWEQDQLREAAGQINRLLLGITDAIRPGMTELELAGTIEGRLRADGHGGTIRVRRPGADIAISTVVSGASAFYPTGFDGPVGAPGPTPPTAAGAGSKRLAERESLMLDIVTSHNGYHVDTTRSYFLGSDPPAELLDAHRRCREVLRSIEDRLRPGETCDRIYVDTLARLERTGAPPGFMGYGENRVRFLGHGVGLELDELPVVAENFDMRLVPGMVLAVEPKAFVEPFGPVGVENTYIVTDSDPENLSPVADELLVLA